jgi:hypothetical protein
MTTRSESLSTPLADKAAKSKAYNEKCRDRRGRLAILVERHRRELKDYTRRVKAVNDTWRKLREYCIEIMLEFYKQNNDIKTMYIHLLSVLQAHAEQEIDALSALTEFTGSAQFRRDLERDFLLRVHRDAFMP